MNISDEFEKIRLFLTKNRLVAVLEEMAGSLASPLARTDPGMLIGDDPHDAQLADRQF